MSSQFASVLVMQRGFLHLITFFNVFGGMLCTGYCSGSHYVRLDHGHASMSLSVSASWVAAALLIIAALPLGLILARILTDKAFRYCT